MSNYKICRYVKSIGQIAVYVEPNCPNGHLIKGNLVTSKCSCEKCKCCERKEEKDE